MYMFDITFPNDFSYPTKKEGGIILKLNFFYHEVHIPSDF